MKRFENRFCNAAVKSFTFIVAAMFAFSACQPEEEKVDPKVEVSENEFTTEAAGGSFVVTVTSNVSWMAEVNNQDKWVTVEPAEGEAGENKVTVSVMKNIGESPRETKITFKGETSTAEVTVKQFGRDNINLDKNSFEAAPAGGTDAVKVTANNNWTATVSEEGSGWVTVSPAEGQAGEATATVTVAENAGAEGRTATITFAAGEAEMRYTVSQQGVSVVLTETTCAVEAEGGSMNVKVTANVDWTAESSADWVSVDPASGQSGETEVTVTVNENVVEEARTATVTFTANENVKVEYTVSQAAMAPVVLNNQYAYTAEGAEVIPVDIKSKFVSFADGYAYAFLVPETGITDMETAMACNEYVVCAVAETALETLMGGQTTQVDLKTVPEGSVKISLVKNGTAVVEYNGSSNEITSGTIGMNVSATGEVVIDVDMVMPDNSKFKANVTFNVADFTKPAGTIAIEVPAVTASGASLVFTPDPVEGFTYYWEILPKELSDMALPNDQDKISYIVNQVNDLLASYSMTWADVIDEGVIEYDYTGLDAATSYYAVAFGIDGNGNVTTGLFTAEFTTSELNPAIKEWMGDWTITSEQTYINENGGTEGFMDTPTERTITIGTSSAFGYELGESDLVVSGLSYFEGLGFFNVPVETIASVNEDGELEFKNGVEVYNLSQGMLTWVGYCWSEAGATNYIVSGNYPPYTLTFGEDKTTGTGTRYSGVLSNNLDFTVVYYDIFVKTENGWGSYYTEPGYGKLAGDWTFKKVEGEGPAPKSLNDRKMKTRIEKQMEVENTKFMMNLYSNYLYQSARTR